MGLANTARAKSAARVEAGNDSVAADSDWGFDEATRGRVRLVCNFINAEIGRWRGQLIAIGAACLVGMVLVPIVTRIVDERVAIVVVAGIMWFWFVRARRELATSYRTIAIKRLVTATNKGFTYGPASSLTREQFGSLGLFPSPGKDWRSAHEIGGRSGGARFSLHAVQAPGTERGPDVFRGVIIRLDFVESFPGHTVIVPEREGQMLGAGTASDAKRDLVLVKNPAFERIFSAYSTDYMLARRMLSANLMEFMIAAARSFPDIRLAFVRRSLFVAVPNVGLLPEVALFRAPVTPEEAAGQIVRLTGFANGLAKAVATAGTNGEAPQIVFV